MTQARDRRSVVRGRGADRDRRLDPVSCDDAGAAQPAQDPAVDAVVERAGARSDGTRDLDVMLDG